MKLTEKKKEEWEKLLRDTALIGPIDTIQEHTQGDLWEFGSQTEETISFPQRSLCLWAVLAG